MFASVMALLGSTQIGSSDGKRMWNIAIGNEWGAHEYEDEAGRILGFSIDFITEVCSVGKMECNIVVDEYVNCWHKLNEYKPTYKQALLSNRYDACTGWTVTIERLHTYRFSQSYMREKYSYFYVLKGQKIITRGHYNVSGKRVGFVTGWSADADCLIRGRIKGTQQMKKISYPRPHNALEGLRRAEVDAVFASTDYWSLDDLAQVQDTGMRIGCFLAGPAMMSRKDSAFIANWNLAYTRFKHSRENFGFCESEQKKHEKRGPIPCDFLNTK